ncbi:MAG: hypothetical protein AB7O48_01225 [Cyclobacteriaceae bacterium]
MTIRNTIATLIFLVGFSGYAQNGEWKTLDENGYSIQYPSDWQLNKSPQMGMSFAILSKLTSEKDQFRENVNLLIQDLSGYDLDLDKYVEISENQIKTMITDGNLILSDRLKKDGKEFQKAMYTGKQGIFKLMFEQFYWVIGSKAYVLTLTCEENQFDVYKNTGEKILESF